MEISNLQRFPQFADVIADRCWHAWWTDSGVSLSQYRAHLDPLIEGGGISFALVAHRDGVYLGSVLVIENDLEARPEYMPWIAALWVEPDHKRRGIAAQLIGMARQEAAARGHQRCYLCATPENSAYYATRGFTQIESGVSGLNVFKI
ncbi:GNAT family N-acetyltransferase [Pleomorphomonas sp. JP5]|uniref:GNAT family N-acetyltransferase n=1 Tax=Pleomorphomonas sp. JP5 TaxID=2942998 RepID=UPI002043D0D7|nr:GNAT family N-acetyltransferase [Pleomorphomonas sp. JP5]MCM5559111.1 GNAT family N-acetyltransferase [Pleomorphomonas sp. JP5]